MPYPEGPAAPGEWREDFFNARDGIRLFGASRVVSAPRAAVVVVHGYSDHCLRYRHVMDALAVAGFSAYAFDYRGHGQAGGKRGYTAAFSDYLDDLTTQLERVRALAPGVPLFILAHSHGCLISGMLLSGPNVPFDIRGAVFSSPYYRLGIVPSAFELFQAKVVGRLIPALPVKKPLASSMLTSDVAFQHATEADNLRHNVVTPRWFLESNAAQTTLLSRARNFKTPLLMMIGTGDHIADPSGGRQFFESAGSTDKKLVEYPGMHHEIFNEVEREKPIGEAVQWLQAHLPAQAATA